MKIQDYIHPDYMQAARADGMVKVNEHPTEPLEIFNYTDKAQIEKGWHNPAVRRSRGLIVNTRTNEIVARPFEKFHNYSEVAGSLDHHAWVRVQDKMDGSLGVLYAEPDSGLLSIATRGSFTSPQAEHATKVLRERYAGFEPVEGFTYLFEIIFPANRIVVDYQGQDDLVLLDIIDNATGNSHLMFGPMRTRWYGPVVEEFDYSRLSDVLSAPPRPGKEGFVLMFGDQKRVKVKYEEYVRLHRIVTGVSNVAIWDMLRHDEPMDAILENVPDEFYDWATKTAGDLRAEFLRILTTTYRTYQAIYQLVDKSLDKQAQAKEFAALIHDSNQQALLFMHFHGQDPAKFIWKQIRPTYTEPIWQQREVAA